MMEKFKESFRKNELCFRNLIGFWVLRAINTSFDSEN